MAPKPRGQHKPEPIDTRLVAPIIFLGREEVPLWCAMYYCQKKMLTRKIRGRKKTSDADIAGGIKSVFADYCDL